MSMFFIFNCFKPNSYFSIKAIRFEEEVIFLKKLSGYIFIKN